MSRMLAISFGLICVGFSVSAQEKPASTILNELSALPKARAQGDLDTTQLAAAQRARATSSEERTNGLWQSWVVAICQGCGVRERQYSPQDEDVVVGKRGDGRTAVSRTDAPVAVRTAAARRINPVDAIEGRGPGLFVASMKRPKDTRP